MQPPKLPREMLRISIKPMARPCNRPSTSATTCTPRSALMIFLVSHTLFETPSNYMLKNFRPGRWLGFLICGWSAITLILGNVQNFGGFTAVRLSLGMFEAGIFPGMVYFLTFWYKQDERAIRVASILGSATLAGAFGGAFGVGKMLEDYPLGAGYASSKESCPVSVRSRAFLLPDLPRDREVAHHS
jgi:MFS family permease